MTKTSIAALSLLLSACAVTTGDGTEGTQNARSASLFSSPECLAAKLQSGEPLPASAIPQAALDKRQSGSVAIRYDVIAGVARNLVVVSSEPAGLYDAVALNHAARYRDPGKTTVHGCVTIIEVKF